MAFVAAKCPVCGGEIQLDDAKESGFCLYCGTKVLLSEAIPQKVRVEGIQTLESKLKNAETYAKLGEIEKAIALLTQITEDFTSDYRAWWMLAKLKYAYGFYYKNEDIGFIDRISSSKEYQYCKILLTDKMDKDIEGEYNRYTSRILENTKNSQQKIEATLAGDYTYINHCYRSNKGFEVITGELYFWEFKEVYQDTYMDLTRINVKRLDISSIDDASIIFRDAGIFKMSGDVSSAYQNCKKTFEMHEKRRQFKIGISLTALILILLLLVSLVLHC